MIQLRTQTETYWGPEFALTEADIEQLASHFLENELPQTIEQLGQIIINQRVAAEKSDIKKMLAGRVVYQPQKSYEIGDELVFPAIDFAHGTVESVREGQNPEHGQFQVVGVQLNGRQREFATQFEGDHILNMASDDQLLTDIAGFDLSSLYEKYGAMVRTKLVKALEKNDDFIRLGKQWFIKPLMLEINVGHLHLTEAILEMNEGGPSQTQEIVEHLDLDPSVPSEVQEFSLNYELLNDARFDEVASVGKVEWFLRRLEPDEVQSVPSRLAYQSISYDRALLSPQLIALEQELDDEWSEIPAGQIANPVVFPLMYHHRLAGSIPLSARITPLFPNSNSPRQRAILIDEENQAELPVWVVRENRYVYGLQDWYSERKIPIGGFIHLKPGPEPGVILLGYDRRRPQREWMRLASVEDNHLEFELSRRSISCGYDDLLIVGTDVITAVDALWKRAETNQRSVASLLAEIFPQLADLIPQKTVHAKTLYSALNMLRRIPPGPLFAELVRHPAFQAVGDHYWRFDREKWRDSR